MKLQKSIIALLALLVFAVTANAQFGGFIKKAKDKVEQVKKTKQEIEQLAGIGGNKNTPTPSSQTTSDNPKSWVTFSKTHTRNNEAHIMSVNTLGCGDSIFATVNYREPVDNSGGYTVSMLIDGEVVLKERMSGGSATSVNETIHIEVIPAPDAVEGYPQVTLSKAKNILERLPQGDHTLQISVSLNDDPKNVAVGKIQYTGGAGCDAKQPRKPKSQKDTTRINNDNQAQTTVNTEQQTTVSVQREEPKPEPVKPAENPEVEIYNSCGDTRYVQIEYPSGSSDSINFHGTSEFHRYPLGTKIYVVTDGSKQLIDTVVANPSDTSYGRQKISLCK